MIMIIITIVVIHIVVVILHIIKIIMIMIILHAKAGSTGGGRRRRPRIERAVKTRATNANPAQTRLSSPLRPELPPRSPADSLPIALQ